MTENKRIAYLDMARGIGMILVVMGHIEYVNMSLLQFIYAFHMPLFFLISGILIWEKQEEKNNYIALWKKKLRSILLPYCFFSVLILLIESARLLIKGLDEWENIGQMLLQTVCLQGISTLWFLPALFMSELLFIGMRRRGSHGVTLIGVSVLTVLAVVLNQWEKNLYSMQTQDMLGNVLHEVLSMLVRNVFCVSFICIGYYLGKWILPAMQRWWQDVLFAILSAVAAVLLISGNGVAEMRYMNLQNPVLYLLGAVAGAMTVLCLCRLLQRSRLTAIKRLLGFLGLNSLIIMVTHMDFRVLYCSIMLAELLNVWENQLFFIISILLLVFLLEIPIIWVVNRFFPWLLGKKTVIS